MVSAHWFTGHGCPNLKVDVIDPVLCKGVPSESDFKALDNLADAIAQKHKEHDFN